jgi:acetyl esterase/lipase
MRRVRPILMLSWLLSACSGTGVLNALAPSQGITVTNGVPYADGDRHSLDIYRPARADAPVAVFLYGGGWKAGTGRCTASSVRRWRIAAFWW